MRQKPKPKTTTPSSSTTRPPPGRNFHHQRRSRKQIQRFAHFPNLQKQIFYASGFEKANKIEAHQAHKPRSTRAHEREREREREGIRAALAHETKALRNGERETTRCNVGWDPTWQARANRITKDFFAAPPIPTPTHLRGESPLHAIGGTRKFPDM